MKRRKAGKQALKRKAGQRIEVSGRIIDPV
jgi:hypothetical protein